MIFGARVNARVSSRGIMMVGHLHALDRCDVQVSIFVDENHSPLAEIAHLRNAKHRN
jgi:hypothetical protein